MVGVKIEKRPNIPTPKKRKKIIAIPGRDGTLVESDGTYEDIDIPVDMNFIVDEEVWGAKYRKVKQWLLSGGNTLIFSDDAAVFYKVKDVNIEGMERAVKCGGKFTTHFLCEPHAYMLEGLREYSISEINQNPYLMSKPIYKIKGEGICTISVNGKTVKANVGQNLTIDTELMIAYREDGTMNNTAITGDYESLYLPEGDLSVTATSGFDVKIIPNWRCL